MALVICSNGHPWDCSEETDKCPECGLPPQTEPYTTSPANRLAWPSISGYRIVKKFSDGNMGEVYLAHQKRVKNRLVVLKLLPDNSASNSYDQVRFLTEIETLASVDDENVVKIYDSGKHEGRRYFVMQYVEGGSLAERLHGVPQKVYDAAELLEKIARGVLALHKEGIIHRDLKPANILIDGRRDEPLSRCTPKVADLGLARFSGPANTNGTSRGEVLGTFPYMPPEQFNQTSFGIGVGPWSDVYSLGAILYEVLTGKVPLPNLTGYDQVRIQNEEPLPVCERNRDVPPDLAKICHICLEKNPALRYPDAGELADDLHRFLKGERIHGKVGVQATPTDVRMPPPVSPHAVPASTDVEGCVFSAANAERPKPLAVRPGKRWRVIIAGSVVVAALLLVLVALKLLLPKPKEWPPYQQTQPDSRPDFREICAKMDRRPLLPKEWPPAPTCEPWDFLKCCQPPGGRDRVDTSPLLVENQTGRPLRILYYPREQDWTDKVYVGWKELIVCDDKLEFRNFRGGCNYLVIDIGDGEKTDFVSIGWRNFGWGPDRKLVINKELLNRAAPGDVVRIDPPQ